MRAISVATRGLIAPNGQAISLVTRGLELRVVELISFDPFIPIHITQVVPGMELQISFVSGRSLIIVNGKNGPKLEPASKSVRTKGYHKTVIKGVVTQNSPTIGELKINVHDVNGYSIIPARVKYSDMKLVHRIIRHKGIIETANNPGAVAFGTKLIGGILLQSSVALIKVKM